MTKKIAVLRTLMFAAISCLLFAGQGNATNHSDPRCKGLTGAAFGLCTAAIAVGCDDPETTNLGCDQIEDNFTQITGESPPWLCQTLEPGDAYYDRFEAPNADNSCNTDADCIVSGCSAEVCAAEVTLTSCEVLHFLPEGNCLCVSGACQWYECSE